MTHADKLEQLTRTQLNEWAAVIHGTPHLSNTLVPSIEVETVEGKTFFEFPDFPTGDDANVLGGARLRTGHTLTRNTLYIRALALAALNNSETDLAKAIMTLDVIDPDILDEAVRHLNNGRPAAARRLLFPNPMEAPCTPEP